MSQNWNLSFTAQSDSSATAIVTRIPEALEALRTQFSGSSFPTNPVPHQRFAHTVDKLIYERNSANTDWLVVGPLGGNSGRVVVAHRLGALAAGTFRAMVAPAPLRIVRVGLMPSANVAASSGNEWRWRLRNQTTGVELFSGTVGTFTVLAGVGGGALTADTVHWLVANQNQNVLEGAALQFIVEQTGSPAAVADFSLTIDAYEVGA